MFLCCKINLQYARYTVFSELRKLRYIGNIELAYVVAVVATRNEILLVGGIYAVFNKSRNQQMYLVRNARQLVYQKLFIMPATFIRVLTETYYLQFSMLRQSTSSLTLDHWAHKSK